MNYEEKVISFLKANMTEKSFSLWNAINNRLPNIWNKFSSSSLKYHKKAEGYIPTIAEHTYEMLYSASKLMRIYYFESEKDIDMLFMAIAFHDSLKYGIDGNLPHTISEHDKLAGDMIATNRETFKKVLSESQVELLEDSVRYHSGKWSTDAKEKTINFKDKNPIVMFIHILDMLSANDLLKMPKE